MKRGKRELRTGGSIVDFCKKKKLSKNVKIEGECRLSSKNNKKEYFREHFRASEFQHTLFSKCYYHKTTSSIARRA